MPDLNLIKEVEQDARDERVRFLLGGSSVPLSRQKAGTPAVFHRAGFGR